MFNNDSVGHKKKFPIAALYCAIVLPIVYGFYSLQYTKNNLAVIRKTCTTNISKAIILLMTKFKHIIREEQKSQNTKKRKKNERAQTKTTNNVIIRKCQHDKVHTAIYKHKKE